MFEVSGVNYYRYRYYKGVMRNLLSLPLKNVWLCLFVHHNIIIYLYEHSVYNNVAVFLEMNLESMMESRNCQIYKSIYPWGILHKNIIITYYVYYTIFFQWNIPNIITYHKLVYENNCKKTDTYFFLATLVIWIIDLFKKYLPILWSL